MEKMEISIGENIVFYTSIVGFSLLFLVTVVCITWYTSTKGDYITNTEDSRSKMTIIYESMRSALGNNWPVVLLIFTLILGLILILLYFLSMKEVFTVNVSEEWSKRFYYSFIGFIILFTVLLLFLLIKAYRNKTVQIANYTPTISSNEKTKQIITIIGLIVGIILLFYILYWFVMKRGKTQT